MVELGTVVIWLLVATMIVVAAKGLVGKADPAEDVGIDYATDGVIHFSLKHRNNK
jgi:hypothetical protein